ncbi:dolichyl-phosphate-mannose-protein mannosyltransferase [Pseudoduganella flava]|uniref:Dolichyl-phosphate-mannose-protein mannosyltransferase n=1 Tax=Pseudoduganella flava TaxID=871742 RepID=A0A562Q0D3_9BURK|nr:glycosyltransferase family 39 protein [Pseudoduganella flava]QGZ38322.1 hypothetical protein GO485_04155 [Pseudoduganella flava]TWI50139.1 dolichyl-phosphate-mannose-protein mannosyltransferase [Pseudoduganella flava]
MDTRQDTAAWQPLDGPSADARLGADPAATRAPDRINDDPTDGITDRFTDRFTDQITGRWLTAAVALLLLARLIMMAWAPLADTTEARYGELARQTVAGGYWLMPHMDAHTPFLAKPPLATWASAASMHLLGITEFAARLPALLCALLTVAVTLAFARVAGVRRPWLVVPVLAACPLFFASAGAVMTDAPQMAIVWAAQYSAWRALQPQAAQVRGWRLAFWALLGLGALSKGLATWALAGLPIAAWALLYRRTGDTVRRLWDWRGLLLALALCLPWYAAAERAYPGFLRYFIVGEHFGRFLVPGWQGDRYGTAHRQPPGAIWLFWCVAVLPWISVFSGGLAALARGRVRPLPVTGYLWCMVLVPLLFFTASRNIIWTYALTAIPPFAVLVAARFDAWSPVAQRHAAYALAAFAAAVLAALPLLEHLQEVQSDRALVRAFEKLAPAGATLAYRAHPAFSSAFYTRGTLRTAPPQHAGLVVVDNADLAHYPPAAVRFHGRRRSLVEEQ